MQTSFAISWHCEARMGGVQVKVIDTGRGIADADVPRAFDEFWQWTNVERGTGVGLGLSLSRRLARGLGGDITLTREPGKGSEFMLWFPDTQ